MKSHHHSRLHLLLLLLLIGLTVPGLVRAGVYTTIYVKPTGNNANNGSTWALAKQTIGAAQTAVRTLTAGMTGDIEVVLGEGTYFTNGTTFTFTDLDSGKNGWRVVWRNELGKMVILSAGKKITDTWTLAGGSVYHTNAAYSFETRQMYVNGSHEYFTHTTIVPNDGTPDVAGKFIDISTANMPTYPAFHPIELVLLTKWATKLSRFTAAASPVPGKTRITPTATHFFDATWEFSTTEKHAYFFQRSSFFTPNQGFYHRPSENIWYYKPAAVNLTTAEIIVPSDQEVLRIAGTNTTTNRARDIVFSGLNFEHTNWTSPSVAANGFIGNQAGQHIDGAGVAKMIPGGVVVLNANEIDFQHCTFQHMGGTGLEFRAYAEQCRVVGCHFTDICGNALLLMPSAVYADYVGKCFISNNLIDNCGVEYLDAVGIFMRFGSFNTFQHNEVKELPYSGISIGWGWGGQNAAPMQDNWCNFNNVHHVMELLKDGAGIYILDDQNDGLGAANWLLVNQNNVHDITLQSMLTPGFGAIGIYVDQGGNHIRIARNAITNISPAPPAPDSTIFDHSLITGPTKALDIINNNVAVTHVAPNAGPIPGYNVYTPPTTYTVDRDIAPQCRAYGSSSYADQYWADRAVDQRSTTIWASGAGDAAPKFTVDFQRSQRVTKIELVARQDATVNDGTRRNFAVYGCSGPNGTGTKVMLGSQGSSPFPQQGTWIKIPITIASYQSLTVEKTDGAHFNFSALRVFSDN